MIELVIDAPHLQSRRQRLAAALLNLAGWLLWCYFLFPLVSLGCWFMDYGQCSQWVDLSGGYPGLREMLGIYFATLAAMVLAWLAWAAYNLAGRRPALPAPPVNRAELCRAFNVLESELRECQDSRYVVVHFDAGGHIIGLEKG